MRTSFCGKEIKVQRVQTSLRWKRTRSLEGANFTLVNREFQFRGCKLHFGGQELEVQWARTALWLRTNNVKFRGCELHSGNAECKVQRMRTSLWWLGKVKFRGCELHLGEEEREVQRVPSSLW